jgi:type I restriction enzyme, S subunit
MYGRPRPEPCSLPDSDATNHIEEGSIGYQDLYVEAVISPIYTVFKTTRAVHDGFLFKLLKTEWYRHIF